MAVLAILQFSLVAFFAAFDPFDTSVLAMTYTLDVLFVLDIIASVMNAYRTDIRNVEHPGFGSNRRHLHVIHRLQSTLYTASLFGIRSDQSSYQRLQDSTSKY